MPSIEAAVTVHDPLPAIDDFFEWFLTAVAQKFGDLRLTSSVSKQLEAYTLQTLYWASDAYGLQVPSGFWVVCICDTDGIVDIDFRPRAMVNRLCDITSINQFWVASTGATTFEAPSIFEAMVGLGLKLEKS